jgi:hypothetical protein
MWAIARQRVKNILGEWVYQSLLWLRQSWSLIYLIFLMFLTRGTDTQCWDPSPAKHRKQKSCSKKRKDPVEGAYIGYEDPCPGTADSTPREGKRNRHYLTDHRPKSRRAFVGISEAKRIDVALVAQDTTRARLRGRSPARRIASATNDSNSGQASPG